MKYRLLGRTEGTPMAEWALAWCLKNPAVSSVIPGCKSPEQAEANAQAAALPEWPFPGERRRGQLTLYDIMAAIILLFGRGMKWANF